MTIDRSLRRAASRVLVSAVVLALAWRVPLSAGASSASQAPQASMASVRQGDFAILYDGRALAGLASTRDPYGAQVLAPGGRLGVMLKYRVEGGDWLDLYQNDPVLEKPTAGTAVYANDVTGTALKSAQTFQTHGRVLDWTIDVANRTQEPIQIGDFALSLPWHAPGGEDPDTTFEKSWAKHQFISGHASFLYFVRSNGEPPYLVVTTQPGTKLEYSTSSGGRGNEFLAFMHSALTGGNTRRAAPGTSRTRA